MIAVPADDAISRHTGFAGRPPRRGTRTECDSRLRPRLRDTFRLKPQKSGYRAPALPSMPPMRWLASATPWWRGCMRVGHQARCRGISQLRTGCFYFNSCQRSLHLRHRPKTFLFDAQPAFNAHRRHPPQARHCHRSRGAPQPSPPDHRRPCPAPCPFRRHLRHHPHGHPARRLGGNHPGRRRFREL